MFGLVLSFKIVENGKKNRKFSVVTFAKDRSEADDEKSVCFLIRIT